MRTPAKIRALSALRLAAIVLFPALTAYFVWQYLTDVRTYVYHLQEDRWVEWTTFGFLFLSALLAVEIAVQTRMRTGRIHPFFPVFGILCFLAAVEEISWGQRLIDFGAPEAVLAVSDQAELNLHNFMQGLLNVKTREVVGLGLLVYAVALPIAVRRGYFVELLNRFKLVTPPLFLALGFFITVLLMVLDAPTTDEEEIGEMFAALAIFIFMTHELLTRWMEPAPLGLPVQLARTRRASLVDMLLLGSVLLLALGLRLVRLDRNSLLPEEIVLAYAAQAGPIEILQQVTRAEVIEPTSWPFVLHAWIRIFGHSDGAVRLASVAAGTFSVLIVWKTLKAVRPDALALRLVASLLLALSPLGVLSSRDAGPYAVAGFVALIAIYAFIRWMLRPTLRWAALSIAANCLMITLQPFTITLLIGEIVVLTAYAFRIGGTAGDRRLAWGLPSVLTASLLAMLFAAPNFRLGASIFAATVSERSLAWYQRLDLIWYQLSYGNELPRPPDMRFDYGLLAFLVVGIGILIGASIHTGANERGRRDVPILAALLIGWIILPLGAAALQVPNFPDKALAFVAPGVLIAAAIGVVAMWQKTRLVGLVAAAALVAIMAYGAFRSLGEEAVDGYQAMTSFLMEHADPGDVALLTAPAQHLLARYYLDHRLPYFPVPNAELPLNWSVNVPPLVPEEVDDQLQAYLRQYPTLWLLLHEEDEVDPGSFVRRYLTATSYYAGCYEWSGVELCKFISPHFAEWSQESSKGHVYADELLLQGAKIGLPGGRSATSGALLVELDWQALSQPTIDYKVSVRLTNESGEAVAQQDDFPIGPLLPPTTWQSGDHREGHSAIMLPAALPSGMYQLQVVVYDPNTLLPIAASTDGANGSDAPVVLGVVRFGIQILPAGSP